MRHLEEDARAIAGVDLGAARPAVIQVAQNLQSVGDDLVRLAAVHIDHEAHAAGVVLEERIVEPLLGRRAGGTARQGAGGGGGQGSFATVALVHVVEVRQAARAKKGPFSSFARAARESIICGERSATD